MLNKILIIIMLMMCFSLEVQSKHLYTEKIYQVHWCNLHNGIVEFKLFDKTRVDCLTPNYALEVDFSEKWAESVGQSLYYAHVTGKIPAILLILEKKNSSAHLKRVLLLAKKFNIKVWSINTKFEVIEY